MIKHMIVWKLKDELHNKEQKARELKVALENLVGKIDGLLEMHIVTNALPSSSGDIMMDSSFENNAALENYQKHPLHQEIANNLVRPAVQQRLSLDYEV